MQTDWRTDYTGPDEDDEFMRSPGCTGCFYVAVAIVFGAFAIYGLIKLFS